MNSGLFRSKFSLLNTDFIHLDKNWNYKNITSTFYRLYLIDSGEGKLSNYERSCVLEKGQLYLIPSFTLCNYECHSFLNQHYLSFIEETTDGSSLFSNNRTIMKTEAIESDYECFKRILQLNPNRGLQRTNPKFYEKRPVLQSFRDLNNMVHISAYIETSGIILQLLSRFMKPEHFKTSGGKKIDSKIHDAVNYIQTNLQSDITVAALADRASQNPDYFSRLFIESIGERPLQYIRFKRIERAQFLLSTTNMSFHEIASETGFNNLPYFTKTFKKLTGQTPGNFKKNTEIGQ